MKTSRSSDKIFIIIIAFLLIANMATLFLLLSAKPAETDDRKNVMRNYVKTEIGFTADQLRQFDTVKSQHRAEMKALFETIRESKKNNLKILAAGSFSDTLLVANAGQSALQQKEVELKVLRHIRDVRKLCTPAQRAVFDTGFYKIMVRPPADDRKKEN